MKKSIKLTLCALALLLSVQAQTITRAVIEANMGNIQLELDEVKASETVANFVNYAKKGFYDNTILHRVIDSFMIQDGGFTEKMVQKSTDRAINSEADNSLKNSIGTTAMVRTGDLNFAIGQFLINAADNDFLNFKGKTPQGYGYAIFGKVASGMDVVRKISEVKATTRGLHQDVPTEAVIICKVSIK